MISEFEIKILIWIQENLRCGFLDFVMPLITYLAEHGLVPIIISLCLIVFRKTRKCGVTMAIALVMGLCVVNLGLKPLVGRIRPYDAYPLYTLLIKAQSDFSFPSGHTLAAFECAVSLALYYRKIAVPASLVAALVGFSRMYLYVHYPTDVIVSVILGTAFAFAAKKICDRIFKKNKI
jgi:undecaprenyl-diphosphatase